MFGNLFSSNNHTAENDLKIRPPAVAGVFYPGNKNELHNTLADYFRKASARNAQGLLGIVSPHAGYAYSGQVAANAMNQIDPNKTFDRIFLIGSSHCAHFDGASVYNIGNYQTPYGIVDVDLDFAKYLTKNHKFFVFNPDAHSREHSIEVQLPLLQFHLKKPFRIVPIIIGTQSEKTIRAIAKALKPYFNEKNLFVVSSDFSHFPDYERANEIDAATAKAISANSPDYFMKTIKATGQKNIAGLATGMCGWSSMLTVLNITAHDQQIEIEPFCYRNSGDALHGDRSRVVGYWAMRICKSKNDMVFNLSEEDKRDLLALARNTLAAYLQGNEPYKLDNNATTEALSFKTGAFVSLYCNGKLRGCIGRFNTHKPLYDTIQKMVVSAAANDPRFEQLKLEELEDTTIEISVLTPLKKIGSIDEIEIGKHGIYIKKGCHAGTFLPQVANDRNWSIEDFLGHCSRDKAKLGWNGWRNAEIFTYEAIVFSDVTGL